MPDKVGILIPKAKLEFVNYYRGGDLLPKDMQVARVSG